MVGIVYLTYRVRAEKEKVRQQKRIQFDLKGNVDEINPDRTIDEQAELLPYDPAWEIQKEHVEFGKLNLIFD